MARQAVYLPRGRQTSPRGDSVKVPINPEFFNHILPSKHLTQCLPQALASAP